MFSSGFRVCKFPASVCCARVPQRGGQAIFIRMRGTVEMSTRLVCSHQTPHHSDKHHRPTLLNPKSDTPVKRAAPSVTNAHGDYAEFIRIRNRIFCVLFLARAHFPRIHAYWRAFSFIGPVGMDGTDERRMDGQYTTRLGRWLFVRAKCAWVLCVSLERVKSIWWVRVRGNVARRRSFIMNHSLSVGGIINIVNIVAVVVGIIGVVVVGVAFKASQGRRRRQRCLCGFVAVCGRFVVRCFEFVQCEIEGRRTLTLSILLLLLVSACRHRRLRHLSISHHSGALVSLYKLMPNGGFVLRCV